MVFSSPIFVFFFLPIVLALYTFSPRPVKNALLLCASLLFYAWGEGVLVVLLLASAAFNYGFARLIGGYRETLRGALLLTLGVVANLGLLAYYKYANFIIDNYNDLIGRLGMSPVDMAAVALPIGISFFTFQSISYLVDVSRGTAQAQRRFVDAALYIALFPQLIAGPIVRYHDVDRQLRERSVSLDLFAGGIRRFVIGLGKKVLIANPLGFVADQVFALPADELSRQLAWLGALCYAFQIYFDFSGYSDMAIGLGRMFGFRFLENFNYPYVSRSIREFWRRWHISLSNWFRDYLYVPLGGNRAGRYRTYANLVIVFFLCGLWHGASWTFAIWGLYHGLFLVFERMGLDRVLSRLWQPLQHLYALLVVQVGWVFFRADDLDYSIGFLRAMFGPESTDGTLHPAALYLTGEIGLTLVLATLGAGGAYGWIARNAKPWPAGATDVSPASPEWSVQAVVEPLYLTLVLLLSCTYLAAGTYNPFIYFRF